MAGGRSAWIGWVELKRDAVDEAATRFTAMVVEQVGADVQACVEVEDRQTLKRFSSSLLPHVGGTPFEHVMVIDGNDDRGIDVGLMTRSGYEMAGSAPTSTTPTSTASSSAATAPCTRWRGRAAASSSCWSTTSRASSARRRRATPGGYARPTGWPSCTRGCWPPAATASPCSATSTTPSTRHRSRALKATDLKDVSEHPSFTADGHVGTWGTARPQDKIDYVLLSPALFARVSGGGVFRKGVYSRQWPHFDGMTRTSAASDHAALSPTSTSEDARRPGTRRRGRRRAPAASGIVVQPLGVRI